MNREDTELEEWDWALHAVQKERQIHTNSWHRNYNLRQISMLCWLLFPFSEVIALAKSDVSGLKDYLHALQIIQWGGGIKFHTLGTGHNRTGRWYNVVTCEIHEYRWGCVSLVVALSFFPQESSKVFCSPKDFPALRWCPHRLTESCNISSSRIRRSTAETVKPLWCLLLKSLSRKSSAPFLQLPAAPAHRLLSLCCKARTASPHSSG